MNRREYAQRFHDGHKRRQPTFYGQSSLRGAVSVGVYGVRGRIGGDRQSSYSTVCCAGLAAATGPERAFGLGWTARNG